MVLYMLTFVQCWQVGIMPSRFHLTVVKAWVTLFYDLIQLTRLGKKMIHFLRWGYCRGFIWFNGACFCDVVFVCDLSDAGFI